MFVKIHKGSSCVLAVCDEDLMGKTFEEGELCLEVNEEFYKGEKKNKEEVLELLKDDEIKSINVVGEESVAVAVEAKVINKENVLFIDGVPHAQSFLL